VDWFVPTWPVMLPSVQLIAAKASTAKLDAWEHAAGAPTSSAAVVSKHMEKCFRHEFIASPLSTGFDAHATFSRNRFCAFLRRRGSPSLAADSVRWRTYRSGFVRRAITAQRALAHIAGASGQQTVW